MSTPSHHPVHAPLPGLGLRSIKTALAATLVALLYAFWDQDPAFACIGAVFSMGSDMENSWKGGCSRLIGTVIGGGLGLGTCWLNRALFPGGSYYFCLPLLFFGLVLLIAVTVRFHWPDAVKPGSVVLCLILFATPENYVAYAIDRTLDTTIGVLAALAVNLLLSRERLERWLRLSPNERK